MRRWISALLASLVLANLVAWPSAALSEVLEHEREAAQNDEQPLPVEPSPVHCPHGCIGHYGQHFQWQGPTPLFGVARSVSAAIVFAQDTSPPRFFVSPPFRPPLPI